MPMSRRVVVRARRETGNMTRMSLSNPTLHTARLRLRPFADADANDLFALHSSASVLRYWDAPPWSEPVRAEHFISACRQMAAEGSRARLAVDRVSDATFIGWCSLTRWNPDYRSAALGYCFNSAAWGHGYATEAARVVLQWGFDTLDLNRVQAETDTRNIASARVLEKLGFVREGTLREDCVVNGEVSDSWVYGLIRREWRPSSEPVSARGVLAPWRELAPRHWPAGHPLPYRRAPSDSVRRLSSYARKALAGRRRRAGPRGLSLSGPRARESPIGGTRRRPSYLLCYLRYAKADRRGGRDRAWARPEWARSGRWFPRAEQLSDARRYQ